MRHLSLETKEAIVRQALNRGSKPLDVIAKENNIGYSTLHKWVKKVREGLPLGRATKGRHASQPISRAEQLKHILATHNLDEVSLGKYCREHGIYSHQLTTWQESLMFTPENKNSIEQSELKKLREENKQLQKELRRKEKALAEASALLVMKKKADLIWGDNEDD